MKTMISLIIAFPIFTLAAGYDQGNGDIRQKYIPSEPFAYRCEATLEQLQPLQQGQEIRDIITLVSKQSSYVGGPLL